MPINPQILPTTPLGRTADTLAEVKRRIAVLERGSAGGGGGAIGAAGGHLAGSFPNPEIASTILTLPADYYINFTRRLNISGEAELGTSTGSGCAVFAYGSADWTANTPPRTKIFAVVGDFVAGSMATANGNRNGGNYLDATAYLSDQLGDDNTIAGAGAKIGSLIYGGCDGLNASTKFNERGAMDVMKAKVSSAEVVPTVAITNVGAPGNVLTVGASHGINVGDRVTVSGATTGTWTDINGPWAVTAVGATTITIGAMTNTDTGLPSGTPVVQRHIYGDISATTMSVEAERPGGGVQGGEWHVGIGAGKWAKAHGLGISVDEANTYASWNNANAAGDNPIWNVNSPWRNTGACGIQLIASGTGQPGTALHINNWGSNPWKRALVIGQDSGFNVAGTEVFCIDGDGRVGIGANAVVNQTLNTTGLPVHLMIAPAATAAYIRMIPGSPAQTAGLQLYNDVSTPLWEAGLDATSNRFRIRDLAYDSGTGINVFEVPSDNFYMVGRKRMDLTGEAVTGGNGGGCAIFAQGDMDPLLNGPRAKMYAIVQTFANTMTNGVRTSGDQLGDDNTIAGGATLCSGIAVQANGSNASSTFNQRGAFDGFNALCKTAEVESTKAITNVTTNVVTVAAHGYIVNDVVTISGATSTWATGTDNINGPWKITAVTTNTFTIAAMPNTLSGLPSGTPVVRRHIYGDIGATHVTVIADRPGGGAQGGEWGVSINSGKWAKAHGLGIKIDEYNTYESYDDANAAGDNPIWHPTSQWRQSGSRGLTVVSAGTGQSGTGIFLSSWASEALFRRPFVINRGIEFNVAGTDVFTIEEGDADGVRVGIGAAAAVTQTLNTSGLPARFVIASTTTPTTAAEGMQFGTTLPASLYRCGDSSLKTAGSFGVGAATALGGAESGMFIASTGEFSTQRSSGSLWRQWGTAGDANPRFQMMFTGETRWGPGGASAVDTGLLRNGVGILQVTDGTSGGFGQLRCNTFKHGMGTSPLLGFYNVTAVARAAALTQTYSTATRTVSNLTSATLTDNTAGTANTTLEVLVGAVYTTDVVGIRNNFADLAAQVNALRVDLENAKQVQNAVIDDLQAYGLEQ